MLQQQTVRAYCLYRQLADSFLVRNYCVLKVCMSPCFVEIVENVNKHLISRHFCWHSLADATGTRPQKRLSRDKVNIPGTESMTTLSMHMQS